MLFMMMFIAVVASFSPVTAVAQDEISGKEKKAITERIVSGYNNWNKAGYQAKIRTELLPLDLTMKVYMERGRLTMISLRAPFVGEAARIEIDNDSIIIVNKLKRRYCTLLLDDVRKIVPDAMEYVQSTLLGRIVVAGHGQLSKGNSKYTTFYEGSDSTVLIVPDIAAEIDATYGYQLDPEMRIATFMAAYGKPRVSDNAENNSNYSFDTAVTVPITYQKKLAVADIEAVFRGKVYNAQVTADPIEWGAKGFERYRPGKGFGRCSIRDVMRF